MQIKPISQKIVEKILRDKEGRLVRARFAVYENAGRIKARLIDVVYLEENNSEVLALSGNQTDTTYFEQIFEKEFVSPFINLNTYFSSGSKPRAPTL